MAHDDELLSIYDENGRQIGTKPRSRVHRDGDWHKLVFLWAARSAPGEGIRFLLQVRSRPGDDYRNNVDALAGGHARAGRSDLENVIRECEEEVGLRLSEEEVVHLGSRTLRNPGAHCERVFQEYFLCTTPISIDELRFSDEVAGFAEVDLDEFEELVTRSRDTIPALLRSRDSDGRVQRGRITGSSLAGYDGGILQSFRLSIALVREYLQRH